ncbi:spore protease YyaC [Bacillaceae bacterium Marseille-Q3522]|nr:spore protease YyaC [Bacillaceae bacterium Marseille-Q3522]
MFFQSRYINNKRDPIRISYEETLAANKVAEELQAVLPEVNDKPIVFVCIGTDRSTGDSLGPLIGTFLADNHFFPYPVYGTLAEPVHAVNLSEKLHEIQLQYENPFIIAVDACLGRLKSVGVIQICNGPVKPGAGVNKDLPEVGQIHITGIVNVSGFMEFFVLQNTRLHLVYGMAKIIAEGIQKCCSHHTINPPSFLTTIEKRQETNISNI